MLSVIARRINAVVKLPVFKKYTDRIGATLVPANRMTVYIDIAMPLIFPPNCPTSDTNEGTERAIPLTKMMLIKVKPTMFEINPIKISAMIDKVKETLRINSTLKRFANFPANGDSIIPKIPKSRRLISF